MSGLQGVKYIRTRANEAMKSDMQLKVLDVEGTNALNAVLKLEISSSNAGFQTITELPTRLAVVAYATILSEQQLDTPIGQLIALVVRTRTLKGLQDLKGLKI